MQADPSRFDGVHVGELGLGCRIQIRLTEYEEHKAEQCKAQLVAQVAFRVMYAPQVAFRVMYAPHSGKGKMFCLCEAYLQSYSCLHSFESCGDSQHHSSGGRRPHNPSQLPFRPG